MNRKIKKLRELARIVKKLKKKGKKIVTTNGSFDLVHAGHVYLLNKTKSQGDILIVGINSDSSVRRYKSKDRPIVPQNYRAEVIAAMEMVDYVFIFNETTPNRFLPILKPDVHATASSYGKNCVEAETVKKIGARLYLVPEIKTLSTTQIIKKILKVYGKKK